MANALRKSAGLSLGLQVPCEPRYFGTVRPLSTRIAAYLGYGDLEAEGVGGSVDAVVQRLMAANAKGGPDARVGVTFTLGVTAVEVWIRCHGSTVPSTELERDLRRASQAGGALAGVRDTMDGVHVGQEAGVAFCCLTRGLPDDAP